MKKIFSLFAAVLFAGSLLATEVTFTKDDFSGQGTANTGSQVSATKDGVTFTYSKGYCADESLRCYAHGAMSITATSTIATINFTTTGGKTGGLDSEVTVNATSYSIADLPSQARLTEIKVTLGEGGSTPGSDTTTIDPQPGNNSILTMTCAEARTAALSVSGNNEEYNNGATYQVQGYVTEIAYAYSEQYHNMSFWMADAVDGGKILEAYKCTIDSEINAPKVGDLVKVTGKLTKYNTTPEFAAGCTCVIVEPATTPVEPQHNYASIEELIAANLPAGTTDVTVTFVNAKITGFYLNSSQQKKGIYIDKQTSDNKDLEIYFSKSGVEVPAEWEIDGYVSGTITGKWDFFERDSQWELVPTTANWSWAELTYLAVPSAVDNAAVAAPVTKLIRNGQVIILRDGIEYNMLGAEVK